MPHLRARLHEALNGKYRIIRELGGGGMSRVFLAEEQTLEREVAIKVLAPELVTPTMLARFKQEMLHTARLQHPTIVPILETGTFIEDGGRTVPFYIMAYVRGESLRTRLRHEGHLSWPLALKITRSLLEALTHAHAHGVVHRDIKPENIFISGTSIVLADFGIAKAMETATAPVESGGQLTDPGTAMGTPAYMAPEQIADSALVDHRADLYSVGVVAYEMLAGRLPWDGRTGAEIIAAKARNRMHDLHALRPDIPDDFEKLVRAVMRWDADERPATAVEVLRAAETIALTPSTPTGVTANPSLDAGARRRRRILTGVVTTAALAAAGMFTVWMVNRDATPSAAAPTPPQLAVLYPEIRAMGSQTTSVRDLLYSVVTSALRRAGVRSLHEVSIGEMMRRGAAADDVTDSLAAARVDTVLRIEASPAVGGTYTLTAQLRRLQTSTSEPISESIPVRSLAVLEDSVLALGEALAAAVIHQLGLAPSSVEIRHTAVRAAAEAYTKGRELYARRTPTAIRAALSAFELAVALDSNYAQAHAELASTLSLAVFYHYRASEPPLALARRALHHANRALTLEPGLADAFVARGYLGGVTGAGAAYLKENYDSAARMSANPYSQLWRLNVLSGEGRFDEAFAAVQAEAARDPRSPAHQISLPLYALPAAKYDTAVAAAARARAGQPGIHFLAALELTARLRSGGSAATDCGAIAPGPYLGLWALCLEALEHTEAARSALDSLARIAAGRVEDPTYDESLFAAELATYHAGNGDTARAREWLHRAFDASPAGLDARLIRAGLFPPTLVALADSLRARNWGRVTQRPK